jgi:hypothetical protein
VLILGQLQESCQLRIKGQDAVKCCDNGRTIGFCIADIGIDLCSDLPLEELHWDEALLHFACDSEDGTLIHCTHGGVPPIDVTRGDLVFDSQGAWVLYHIDGRHVFLLRDVIPGPYSPYVAAIFAPDFAAGEIHTLVRDSEKSPTDGLLRHPLSHPLGQVLMICLLGQGRGLMVHACGIEHEGKGYLFCGHSTHGKTTMARLWAGQGSTLNDDRVVLRHRDGRVWMYGTPWHGDHASISCRGVPLDKVFFLKKSSRHTARLVRPAPACSMILARSFPPLWDGTAMSFTLGFLSDVVSEVACYELSFAADSSIVEFVTCME